MWLTCNESSDRFPIVFNQCRVGTVLYCCNTMNKDQVRNSSSDFLQHLSGFLIILFYLVVSGSLLVISLYWNIISYHSIYNVLDISCMFFIIFVVIIFTLLKSFHSFGYIFIFLVFILIPFICTFSGNISIISRCLFSIVIIFIIIQAFLMVRYFYSIITARTCS